MVIYLRMLFIYFKVLIFTLIIFFSGLVIVRRATKDCRAQIIFPTAAIFGLSLYLFLTNALAYLIKGPLLFYISLTAEMALAYVIHKKTAVQPLEFPIKGLKFFWIFSLIFWGILLFVITNTSPFNGGHDTEYQSFASLFARGDYPVHAPWQPDYLAFLHLGASQLLGSLRILTGANYYLVQAFIAFLSLWSCSQILTWILDLKNKKSFPSLFIYAIPAFAGVISLGSFMLVWPARFAFPDTGGNFVNWLTSLPALEMPNPPQFPYFGHLDYISLDAIILFLQRVTAFSFFIGLLPILLSPSEKKKYIFSAGSLIILLATIALTDESVLIPALPIVFLTAIFIFEKKLAVLIPFVIFALVTIAIQGGTVTEVLLNRYGMGSGTLIFPSDRENPFEKFRTWRMVYQSSHLYNAPSLQPFSWFRPGIIWLLAALLLVCSRIAIFFRKRTDDDKKLNVLILIMFLSSLGSFLAFHIIVPHPFHSNGWRFLFLSYQLAGIGIGFSLIYFWGLIPKKLFSLKIIIVWILFFSFFPSMFRLFPRRSDLSWFTVPSEPKKPIYEWVKNNLPLDARIIALTDANPIPSSNANLVKQIGAFTPIWPEGIRNYDALDTSPTYADLYYTLNPHSLQKLKAAYLIINNLYLSQLPEARKPDIFNKEFFQTIYTDPSGEVILKLLPKYLESGINLEGTLEELDKIAPREGTFFIDHKSTHEVNNLYRSIVLLFRDRIFYGETDYWNSRLSVNIPFYGLSSEHYDYIVGGRDLDLYSICRCQTKLLWSGLEGRVNLWQTL